ncbi:MAG: DUF120 domain-containing protein [Nanoarchaeota archaeon]
MAKLYKQKVYTISMGEIGFEGTIKRGLGKGAVFLSIDYYKDNIREKLGFDPYPGTLNLEVGKGQQTHLKAIIPIRIESFKKNGRVYGGASCYKVKINGINAAIIVPDLTEHEESMIEIIASVNLKSKLKVEDGDKIKIELVQ